MPSLISHAVVGVAAAAMCHSADVRPRFWVLSAAVSVLPDADALAFKLGIPYSHLFGHRGFFHSLLFAAILGILVTTVFFRGAPLLSRKWLILALYFSIIAAMHGVLDAFTSGGLGVALFAPFNNSRYFFPWTPIMVSPLGIAAFFSRWGLRVLQSEAVWIWLPSAFLTTAVKIFRRGFA